MPDLEDDTLDGRVPLPQLIEGGIIPYRDPRQAKRFLDRYRVPYVVIRRQRCYRPPAIREALDRDERRQLDEAVA